MKNMRSLLNCVWLATLFAALLCGCGGKHGAKVVAVDPKAFDAADPAVKQTWDQALASAQNKDLGSAITTLRKMSRQSGVMPEQQKTIFDAIVNYESQVRANAKAGDAAAVKTMETLGISPNPES